MRFRLALLGVLLAAPCLAQETACQWVWYPENPTATAVNQDRWLRKSFDLPAAPTQATLWLLVDDNGRLWVNGLEQTHLVQTIQATARYDLAKVLHQGKNVIAVQVHNNTGPAGVIARLIVQLPGGRQLVIPSDTTWRAAKTLQKGWDSPDFNDATWVAARSMGSAFTRPWSDVPRFYLAPFITKQEQAAYDVWEQRLLAPASQFAHEQPARAQIKQYHGAPAVFINDQPRPAVMYRGSIDPLAPLGRRQLTNFSHAGIHLFLPYAAIDTLWPKPGHYDFSFVDTEIRAYLSADPTAYLVLQIRLVPPKWWIDAHPNEWVRYATSDKLDGTNESERIKRPSPASDVWLRETGALWRALIQHVDAQPWGKRVVGWQACYGISAEWHYFGSWTQQYPDTGQAMTRTFRAWLRHKYGNDGALQQAWHDPRVTFDTATVPGVLPRKNASLFSFRDASKEQRVIDYYRCQQGVIADDIEYFGKIAKQVTGGRALYGVYYGYFYDVLPETQGGHLALLRLLHCPYIDYFAAPYDYSNRLMGQDGRLRSLAAAINQAGKAHFMEADIRTYLHPRNEYGRTQNLTQSLAAIRREFSTALIEHTGFWFVDFGPAGAGGWFDEPHMMSEIAGLQKLAQRALTIPRHDTAQIAMVCDLNSAYYLGDGEGMTTAYQMIQDVGTEMYRLGAPFDGLLLPQLPTADLSRYKMLVFLNTFAMTNAQADFIRQLREAGKQAMVFMWAPGLCGPDGLSAQRVSQITGFDMALLPRRAPEATVVTDLNDPLTRGLPPQKTFTLQTTTSQPVGGLDNPANWKNPRSAATMKAHYKQYQVQPIPGGIKWTIDTTDRWTDIHWYSPIPRGAGLGLEMRVTGASSQLSLQFVVKDANLAEFVAPPETFSDNQWHVHQYPLASLVSAPWSAKQVAKPTLPLRGLKFVVSGTANAGPITIELRNLRSLQGKLVPHEVCRFGQGIFGPVLAAQPGAGRVLGHLEGCDEAQMVASGQGTRTVLYCPAPFVTRELLANVMKQAGVHRYDDNLQDVVRADSRFLAIHTKEGGPRKLDFGRDCTVLDAVTGKKVGRGPVLDITLPADSTTILEMSP